MSGGRLRRWVRCRARASGVYLAHIPLSVWIGTGGPETQPDTIAEHYRNVHTKRDGAEHHYAAG